jgi:hypothetical protein
MLGHEHGKRVLAGVFKAFGVLQKMLKPLRLLDFESYTSY